MGTLPMCQSLPLSPWMVDLPTKMTAAMKAAIEARAKKDKREVVKVVVSKVGKRSVLLGLHCHVLKRTQLRPEI